MIVLRSLVFVAVFYLWSAVSAIVMLPLLLGPRRWMMKAMIFWALTVIALVRVICGVRVEVRGREHLPTGRALDRRRQTPVHVRHHGPLRRVRRRGLCG